MKQLICSTIKFLYRGFCVGEADTVSLKRLSPAQTQCPLFCNRVQLVVFRRAITHADHVASWPCGWLYRTVAVLQHIATKPDTLNLLFIVTCCWRKAVKPCSQPDWPRACCNLREGFHKGKGSTRNLICKAQLAASFCSISARKSVTYPQREGIPLNSCTAAWFIFGRRQVCVLRHEIQHLQSSDSNPMHRVEMFTVCRCLVSNNNQRVEVLL